MSVNGTGKDRKNNKALPDSTTWSVLDSTGKPVEGRGGKEKTTLTGLSAAEAFAQVRNLRTRGIFAAAVRS